MEAPLTDAEFEKLLQSLGDLPPPDNVQPEDFFNPTLLPTSEPCLSYFPSLLTLMEEESSGSVETSNQESSNERIRLLQVQNEKLSFECVHP